MTSILSRRLSRGPVCPAAHPVPSVVPSLSRALVEPSRRLSRTRPQGTTARDGTTPRAYKARVSRPLAPSGAGSSSTSGVTSVTSSSSRGAGMAPQRTGLRRDASPERAMTPRLHDHMRAEVTRRHLLSGGVARLALLTSTVAPGYRAGLVTGHAGDPPPPTCPSGLREGAQLTRFSPIGLPAVFLEVTTMP